MARRSLMAIEGSDIAMKGNGGKSLARILFETLGGVEKKGEGGEVDHAAGSISPRFGR